MLTGKYWFKHAVGQNAWRNIEPNVLVTVSVAQIIWTVIRKPGHQFPALRYISQMSSASFFSYNKAPHLHSQAHSALLRNDWLQKVSSTCSALRTESTFYNISRLHANYTTDFLNGKKLENSSTFSLCRSIFTIKFTFLFLILFLTPLHCCRKHRSCLSVAPLPYITCKCLRGHTL